MIRAQLARIGADQFISEDESRLQGEPVAIDAWPLYRDSFGGFTGARSDPQFARFDHPATISAQPAVAPDTTVVIAGSGPSLATRIDELQRLRNRLSIWTSLRGAEALAVHGITADLILIQHASDLDAHLTARHLRDRDGDLPIGDTTIVLAEPKTPRTLIDTVDRSRLALCDPACGWGFWPASLAWLAAGSGARSIALVGIDLGANDTIDPAHEPLCGLLHLIASGSSIPTVDAGGGVLKPGWPRQPLDAAVGAKGSRHVALRPAGTIDGGQCHARLESAMSLLHDHLEASAMFRTLALEERRRASHRGDARLREAWSVLLAWRDSTAVRTAFQEEMGATFLPRFWRGADHTLPGPYWRPVLLACEEIAIQAARARARVQALVMA